MERNISITLEEAKKYYNSNNTTLKKLALKAFSEQELKSFDITTITSFEAALNKYAPSEVKRDSIIKSLTNTLLYSLASYAMIKLNIVREVLNTGYNMHLTKNADGQNYIWYPRLRFITQDCTYYNHELKNGILKKIGEITSEGVTYDVLGGDARSCDTAGLGHFDSEDNVGYTFADCGFLGCATKEMASQLGKYFGMLIIQAMYGDLNNIEFTKTYE